MIRIDAVFEDGQKNLWKIIECHGSMNRYFAKKMEPSEWFGYYKLTDDRVFTKEELAGMKRL